MSEAARSPVDQSLRRAHRSVLALLVLCAVAIATQAGGDEPPPDRVPTIAAVVLGLVTVAARRLGAAPNMGQRARVRWILASYTAASGLGLIGVFVAFGGGGARTALGFALAAAIFCLRPPPSVVPVGAAT